MTQASGRGMDHYFHAGKRSKLEEEEEGNAGGSTLVTMVEVLVTLSTLGVVASAVIGMIMYGGTRGLGEDARMLVSTFSIAHAPTRLAFDRSSFALTTGYYEVFENLFSNAMLGSYNWTALLLLSMWILSSFGVYSLWLFSNDTGYITRTGKPYSTFARCGFAFTLTALIWNVIGVIVVLVWALRGESGRYPMTTTTVTVGLGFTLLSVLYYMRELKEFFVLLGARFWFQHGETPEVFNGGASVATTTSALVTGEGGARYAARFGLVPGRMVGLSAVMKVPSKLEKGSDVKDASVFEVFSRRQYVPLLCTAWADASVLVDPLLLAGAMGAAMNVVSYEAGVVFLTTLYLGVVRSALVRLVMDASVMDVPGEKGESQYWSEDRENLKYRELVRREDNNDVSEAAYELRSVGMFVHAALVVLSVAVATGVLVRYGNGASETAMLVALVSVCVIGRAAAWFVGHVVYEMWPDTFKGSSFRVWCEVDFLVGLVVRVVLVWMLVSVRGHEIQESVDLLKGAWGEWHGSSAVAVKAGGLSPLPWEVTVPDVVAYSAASDFRGTCPPRW